MNLSKEEIIHLLTKEDGNSLFEKANKVREELQKAGIRVEVDTKDEKIGYKIREAQVQKVPYMLVVGDKEVEGRGVSSDTLKAKMRALFGGVNLIYSK